MRTTVSCQRITFGFMVWALTGMLTSAAEPDNAPAIAPPAAGWKYLGQLKTRSAKEITASNWSVGAETMDRDFTIYDHWKSYLGPLGAKHARLQSGWAKTETKAGVYDFAWLDAIVDDMLKQGVKPWICICYGNTIYEGGGGTGLGGGLPTGAGLAAWDKYVAALVSHYRDRVEAWEIWNEPNLNRAKNGAAAYGEFLIRTAEIVRAQQPRATIIAFGLAGTSPQYVKEALQVVKEQNKLGLINEISYHPYTENPDTSYAGAVKGLRVAVKEFSADIKLRQGENGCPSERSGFGALTNHDWTETSQAKWAIRRLLGDLGHDIPSSYFSIADMHYLRDGKTVMNHKGLLKTNADKTIARPKPAYRAMQHLTSIFDTDWERMADFAAQPDSGEHLAIYGYAQKQTHTQIVTIWESGHTPGDGRELHQRTVTLPRSKFTEPVYLDFLSGAVFAIPEQNWKRDGEGVKLLDLPVYDAPIAVVERSAITAQTTK